MRDEYQQLKQQLAEKEKEKIKFAIAELEKVFSDFNHKIYDEFGDNDARYITLDVQDVNFYLQDRINELKGIK